MERLPTPKQNELRMKVQQTQDELINRLTRRLQSIVSAEVLDQVCNDVMETLKELNPGHTEECRIEFETSSIFGGTTQTNNLEIPSITSLLDEIESSIGLDWIPWDSSATTNAV
ncbi:hypothetical protein HJFPF1_10557 [Paramyrothecium foliicola]|nr:hypothetical protein HJFPF1_10557 [Paramyrothecium foliicola]